MNPVSTLGRLAAASLTLAGLTAALPAHADCRSVHGSYVEQTSGATCASPFGVCLSGRFTGVMQGSFFTTVDTFAPLTGDPPAPVALFGAVSTLDVRIGGRTGTLWVRNAGAVRLAGDGEIVDVQSIVGGSGGLAGATGVITASGNFSFATGGHSTMEGSVCVPGAF